MFEIIVKLIAVKFNSTVVAQPITTIAVLSITVADPDMENFRSTGIVLRLSITEPYIPFITVGLLVTVP